MKLSVLVPVYNDQDNILPFFERTRPVLDALRGLDGWEIVFLNDCSADASLDRILGLRERDPRVKVLTLSRNFGYHANLIAGLSCVESDLYFVIHVDCEDPPELLPRFQQAVLEGAQVAYGIRSRRPEPRPVTWFRSLFYHVNRLISDSPTILWMAEFVLFTRCVRDKVLVSRTTYPFLRAEIAHVGLKSVGIPYERERRRHGRSHFNLYTLTEFAIAGFLASSTFPLRLVLYLAAALAVAFPLAVAALGFGLRDAAGLASILLFYFCLLAIPMLALYLARTYQNGVARPLFVVDPARTRV